MIDLTDAQSAVILSAIHSGLGLALTHSPDTEHMRLQAYAEIVADPMHAANTLALGEAIDTAVSLTLEPNLIVDPSALIEEHGNRMTRRALMYAGVSPDQRGTKTQWKVGCPRENSSVLKLPPNMLEDWFGILS